MKAHADGQEGKECGGATHGGNLHDFGRLRQEKFGELKAMAPPRMKPPKLKKERSDGQALLVDAAC
ncbi:hypothetical protein [Prosthecobacter sp.]|uniref:hypothetical protein n=1 Tax=Prosthecobacter sp. TaxID=1965333 RepID=UPI002486D214|nr:hypothetical protein [Prosthecobacter sp.]MDI1313773.1 hypothetical protein [Prosthecobacter sp.]